MHASSRSLPTLPPPSSAGEPFDRFAPSALSLRPRRSGLTARDAYAVLDHLVGQLSIGCTHGRGLGDTPATSPSPGNTETLASTGRIAAGAELVAHGAGTSSINSGGGDAPFASGSPMMGLGPGPAGSLNRSDSGASYPAYLAATTAATAAIGGMNPVVHHGVCTAPEPHGVEMLCLGCRIIACLSVRACCVCVHCVLTIWGALKGGSPATMDRGPTTQAAAAPDPTVPHTPSGRAGGPVPS